MENHNELNCACHSKQTALQQNLSELDFERGIWNAAIYNEIEKVKKFISNGKTNDRDNFGYTALHYSARNGNDEICRLLISNGADVNAITNGGATPLHRAAMMGHTNIVKILIKCNAKLNIQDQDGQTVLHRAAQKADFEISKLLLENDQNLKLTEDRKGQLPIDLVPESSENSNKMKLLLKS